MLEIKGKKVAVIGLGKRTGVATAKMLSENGAQVVVSDVKGPDDLQEELDMLSDYDLEYDLNGHGQKSLTSDLIVVSPGVPLDIPFFSRVENRGVPVISEIELAYHFTSANIIAITGTNGKTTTTSLLGKILKKSQLKNVKVAGNIGVPLIQEVTGLSADDWVVAEVSSFQLETIRNFRPEISIYLNFTPDHLDRHKTVENYWQAKKRIFLNQKDTDFAIINFDDQEVVRAAEDCQAQIFGVSLQNDNRNGIIIHDDKLYVKTENDEFSLISLSEIPLTGVHNIQNVAFALMAAWLLDVRKEVIRKEIKKFQSFPHRLQKIDIIKEDILIIDDSKATNPDAAIKALLSYPDRSIVLIAGGQDRNADFTKFAEVIKEQVKVLILLGETRNELENIVLNTGFENIYKVKDMEEAVKTAWQEIETGDCLLLSPGCPSWDMYESYRERGKKFQSEIKMLR